MNKDTTKKGQTSICDFDEDHILIRDKNLVQDLVGKYSFTQAWLLQALGTDPSELQLTIVDAVLVTIMEHGLVPSAIATRLTIHGAPESFQGAIAAGLLGVGDRYAGTASECGAIFERICNSEDMQIEAKIIIKEYRSSKKPVPGFGHPIHKSKDLRVNRLLEICQETGVDGRFIEAMHLMESCLSEELGKKIVTNVSAAIGAALAEASIPSNMMRGVVLTARCAGLVGHLMEELNTPAASALWEGAQKNVDYHD